MNDKVQEIFTQMFAPHEIPQPVIDMYNRTKFLADRVDAPIIPISGLVLIAATATKTAAMSASKPIEPAEVDTKEVSETLPTEGGDVLIVNKVIPAPEPPVEPTSAAGAMNGPLGEMDAPEGATTEAGKASLAATLVLMTKEELIEHATGVLKMTKRQICGRKKNGPVTKSDMRTAKVPEIIERILGKTNERIDT